MKTGAREGDIKKEEERLQQLALQIRFNDIRIQVAETTRAKVHAEKVALAAELEGHRGKIRDTHDGIARREEQLRQEVAERAATLFAEESEKIQVLKEGATRRHQEQLEADADEQWYQTTIEAQAALLQRYHDQPPEPTVEVPPAQIPTTREDVADILNLKPASADVF